MGFIGQIAEAAIGAPDVAVFRGEVLRLLGRFGYARAVFVTHVPLVSRDNVISGGDPGDLELVRTQWDSLIDELKPMFLHGAEHGVTRIEDVMSRARYQETGLYRDVYRPLGLDRFLHVLLAVPGHAPALVGLVRERRDPGFTDADVRALLAARPTMALGDVARRGPTVRSPLTGALHAADHELVELMALGYTNQQIAVVMGRSPNTIRNRLARLYRRVGVASRAELLGVLRPA